MTNELEKQFFNTFGIEPREHKGCNSFPCSGKECENCNDYITYKVEYPTITDNILLELICIANEQDTYPSTTNMNNIKARTLKMLLGALKFSAIYTESPNRRRQFIKRVRTLFEEG